MCSSLHWSQKKKILSEIVAWYSNICLSLFTPNYNFFFIWKTFWRTMYFGLLVFKVAKLKESTVAQEFATSPCSALQYLKMSTVSHLRGRVRTKRCLYISLCTGGNPLRRTKYLFSFAFSWSVQLDVSTTFVVCFSELYLLKPPTLSKHEARAESELKCGQKVFSVITVV